MSVLRDEWQEITRELPQNVSDAWWLLIDKKYSEKTSREAHSNNLLILKFKELSKFRSKLKHFNAFKYALFFQYLNYDARGGDCSEENIRIFKKFSQESDLKELDIRQIVYLLETSSSQQLTEEHKTEAFGDDDLHYFLDLDMLPLGQSTETYFEYAEDVSKEHSYLDEKSYKNLRKRVLNSFLLIPNIYATQHFRDNYEESAKNNIKNELKTLL